MKSAVCAVSEGFSIVASRVIVSPASDHSGVAEIWARKATPTKNSARAVSRTTSPANRVACATHEPRRASTGNVAIRVPAAPGTSVGTEPRPCSQGSPMSQVTRDVICVPERVSSVEVF